MRGCCSGERWVEEAKRAQEVEAQGHVMKREGMAMMLAGKAPAVGAVYGARQMVSAEESTLCSESGVEIEE